LTRDSDAPEGHADDPVGDPTSIDELPPPEADDREDLTPPGLTPNPARPPGASVFSLEGRAAPGLYLVGWLGSVLGLAIFVADVLSAPGGAPGLALLVVSTVLLAVGLVAAAGAQGMQRRAQGQAYSGPSPLLVFIASLPVSLPVAVILLRFAENLGVDPAGPLGSVIGQAVLVLGLVLLVRLLVVGAGALTWSEMRIRWPGGPAAIANLASGAVLALPVILATAVIAAVLVGVLGTTPESPLPVAKDPMGIGLNFLAAVVIAPIGEEIFFRGFSLTAWERSVGRRSALIRAALFFALVHVLTVGGASFSEAAARAFIGFAVRVPVALALGWVFLERRSILAPIGLHATFNALLLIISTAAVTTP
jgi:membrane protease YdiL (CAAX protease family)